MSRATPNPLDARPPNPRRAGSAGAPGDIRETLLAQAGITPEVQASAAKKSFDKKVALLESRQTKYFAHEGEVIEEREVALPEVQLKAAIALDQMLGTQAPPASRSVTVVHTIEWPEWFRLPEEQAVTTIEVEGGVV